MCLTISSGVSLALSFCEIQKSSKSAMFVAPRTYISPPENEAEPVSVQLEVRRMTSNRIGAEKGTNSWSRHHRVYSQVKARGTNGTGRVAYAVARPLKENGVRERQAME